jgi:hypothetical protein
MSMRRSSPWPCARIWVSKTAAPLSRRRERARASDKHTPRFHIDAAMLATASDSPTSLLIVCAVLLMMNSDAPRIAAVRAVDDCCSGVDEAALPEGKLQAMFGAVR